MIQLLPIATLRTMSADELDELAIASVKLEKKAKETATEHKSSFPATGKIVCVVEERLNTLKTSNLIAKNTSLASYWESITKQKLNNHALSCSVTFGTYVQTDLVSEKDYDLNTAQCLELAASISTAVGGQTTHDAVVKASTQLKERGKDAAKNLRAILDTVKARKAMDADKAAELLKSIFADGHLGLVIAGVGAEVAYIEKPDAAIAAYEQLEAARDMFANTPHWQAICDHVDALSRTENADKQPANTLGAAPHITVKTDDGKIPVTDTAAVNAAIIGMLETPAELAA